MKILLILALIGSVKLFVEGKLLKLHTCTAKLTYCMELYTAWAKIR